MKKIGKYSIILYVFFMSFTTQAQTFFTEDFNSYPIGHLNTNYDNTTPGQGGWLVSRNLNSLTTGMITAEAGKGNVLTITTNSTTPDGCGFTQEDGFLNTLWNNRTPGNNIFKFEYEFYGGGTFNFGGNVKISYKAGSSTLTNIAFQSMSNLNRILGGYLENTSSKSITLKSYTASTFPYNMWIKAEMFVDFNANNVYFYIPILNLQATAPFNHNYIPGNLYFGAGNLNTTSTVKIDNIKVSGLKTLPPYILSANEQLAAKFNMYPNPATNVVNITNAENMLVQQVTVYDIAGKQLSTQSFNNQTEIQLNVENLASGTYMLYLQTTEGIAVKKLVKK